jgi:type IV pilus assembly protein PilV
MRRRPQAGFTLIEIMVSLAVIIIGLLGIMALQATTVRQNRLSRAIERARVYASQMMEDLRSKPAAALVGGSYPSVPTVDGLTYTRSYAVAGVTGSTNLILITGTASFIDPSDGTTHTTNMQIVRTTLETL